MYVMFVDNPVDVVLHMVKRETSQIDGYKLVSAM